MTSRPAGRSLSWIEIAACLAVIVIGGLLAPAGHRVVWQAALLVPLACYNMWVSRSRGAVVLLAAAVVLLGLAFFLPPALPTGAAPP